MRGAEQSSEYEQRVILAAIHSSRLYEELNGVRLSYAPGPVKAALSPSGRVECTLPPSRPPPGVPAPAHALFEAERRDPGPESLPHVHLATVQAEAVRLCIRCDQRPRSLHAIALCDECNRVTDEFVARRRP